MCLLYIYTPLSDVLRGLTQVPQVGVTCITIIVIIIHHIHNIHNIHNIHTKYILTTPIIMIHIHIYTYTHIHTHTHPRSLRWLNVMMQILINLFIDTIFFGIFFPDTGVCEAILFETGMHTIYDMLHTIHYTLYTIHSTLYTIHYTLYTIHNTNTPYTIRTNTPYILFETDCEVVQNSVVNQVRIYTYNNRHTYTPYTE
jgi:hypothetical protein